jgi:hypothetical protein
LSLIVVTNTKIDAGAVAIYWVPAASAKALANKARNIMGNGGDIAVAISAVTEAAAACRITLTPHDVAISRAGAAVEKLDAFVDGLRKRGFTKETIQIGRCASAMTFNSRCISPMRPMM